MRRNVPLFIRFQCAVNISIISFRFVSSYFDGSVTEVHSYQLLSVPAARLLDCVYIELLKEGFFAIWHLPLPYTALAFLPGPEGVTEVVEYWKCHFKYGKIVK